MCTQQTLQILQEAFSWAEIQASDIDDQKYTFLKKLSEHLAHLGAWIESKPEVLKTSGNMSMFFTLFLAVTRHPSLLVSTPLLQLWVRLLRSRSPEFSDIVQEAMAPLLELCSQRSVRWDTLPEDSTEPTLVFLAEDCDTMPQREALLQQYRQACVGVVELVVRKVPVDAIKHILGEAATFFQEVQSNQFSPQSYMKQSIISIKADAHITTVDAATRGCLKWLAANVDTEQEPSHDNERIGHEIRELYSQWTQSTLNMPIPDPDIKRKLIAQVVSITAKILADEQSVGFTVLDKLLSIRSEKIPASVQYGDASKDLLETCAFAAQKLATVFADQFLTIYDQLEERIAEIIATEGADLQPRYAAFLVMIIHRASNLDTETRTEKIRRMVMPVKQAWEDANLVEAVSNYESFSQYLGWDQLPAFISNNRFHEVPDWSSAILSEPARHFQKELLDRNEQLPIKLTKALLHATTEKMEEGSTVYKIACTVWAEILPSIVPQLLKMLSNATSFHSRERWPNMPDQLHAVVKRMVTDRFWQNGISAESRDAFVSRINSSKHTYEGFGSTVRKSIRNVRVGCCDILLLLSKLGEVFYGISDLPDPLADAMYSSSQNLSCHHFSILITFSSQLINGCPVHLRQQFLPAVLAKLFYNLVYKVDAEWDAVNMKTEDTTSDESLDDEMKSQSILRSMTYNGCYLFFALMDQRRPGMYLSFV
jgi:exportin-5